VVGGLASAVRTLAGDAMSLVASLSSS